MSEPFSEARPLGTLEIEAESREDALAQGLTRLGLQEEDVEVETVESRRGLLGFLGRSPIRLRIHFNDLALRLAAARETLEQLIGRMGLEAPIEADLRDGAVHLNIRGRQLGILIGRRGETLDALECLVERMVNRPPHERIRIHLDAEGYRERTAENLRDMATRLARKAVRTGRPVTCRPMNARDRRLVHTAVRDIAGVETFSEGEGSFRRVVISPAP
ncbi:MAG: RNA-binding cell elongation regulator Jag/EloR [Nitrospinota bacterium]